MPFFRDPDFLPFFVQFFKLRAPIVREAAGSALVERRDKGGTGEYLPRRERQWIFRVPVSVPA